MHVLPAVAREDFQRLLFMFPIVRPHPQEQAAAEKVLIDVISMDTPHQHCQCRTDGRTCTSGNGSYGNDTQ